VSRWIMLLDALLKLRLLSIYARIIKTLSDQTNHSCLWYNIQIQLTIYQTCPRLGQITKNCMN